MQFLVVGHRAKRRQLRPDAAYGKGLERRFVRLITIAPGGGPAVIHAGIDQFETRSLAARQRWPVAADFEIHLVGEVLVRINHPDEVALAADFPGPISQMRHSRIGRLEKLRCPRDHEIAARGNTGAGGNIEVDAAPDGPSGECHGRTALVVEFDEFRVGLIRDRVRHDLVDDNVRVGRHAVRSVAGVGGG